MRERPILFNADMVRAVLNGSKTQTRRMLSPRHLELIGLAARAGECSPLESGHQHANSQSYYREFCPFGAVGDRLWVRETWSEDFANYYPHDRVWYAAADDRRLDIEVVDGVRGIFSPESNVHVPFRWRPSIHMPRWASRITLEITGVRVEPLQTITLGDICKEIGCSLYDFRPATDGFRVWAELWNSIYGEDSWQANPWVWVVEFKRVEGD